MDPTSSILTTLLQLTYSLSPVPNRTVYKSSDRLFVPDFDQWCQIHSTFDSCLAGCNQTGLGMSPFYESFQPLDYICAEQNNFTDSDDYKCLQKYENDAIKNCLNDSEAMKNDADYLYGIRRADSDNATLIAFDKTCSSTSSAMICMSPIWDDKCGEDGEIILNNYFALTYYFVEQLKKALGITTSLSGSCKSLVEMAEKLTRPPVFDPINNNHSNTSITPIKSHSSPTEQSILDDSPTDSFAFKKFSFKYEIIKSIISLILIFVLAF